MKYYETTIIIDPTIGDEAIAANITKVEELIKSTGGEILEIVRTGIRKMAYPVKKHREADFSLFRHNSPAEAIEKIRGQVKLNEQVLRIMSIKISDTKGRVKPTMPEAAPAEVSEDE